MEESFTITDNRTMIDLHSLVAWEAQGELHLNDYEGGWKVGKRWQIGAEIQKPVIVLKMEAIEKWSGRCEGINTMIESSEADDEDC